MRIRITGLLLLAAALMSTASYAAQGNPKAGKKKVAICLGCHGIEDYKKGERTHPSMTGIAQPLSDQDMADIAAYFGAQK